MSDMIDQHYMLTDQYKTAANLQARIQLHERFSTNPADWQRWVFDQLALEVDARILELGCGPGTLWVKNYERIPSQCHLTLSDFSPGMLDEARHNLPAHDRRFSFQVVDAQAIPFADDSFDCVIANHMLYHVPDRSRAFAEIRRVLRPPGRFYAATNGEAHLWEMALLCKHAGVITISGALNASSVSVFSLQNGIAQMEPWFAQIDLLRWENNLAVTEAEPLMAFILSCMPLATIDPATVQSLRALIDRELAEHGVVHIGKETGLFIAYGKK